jgi:pimeloyl-ACP methyl ester carboxylesterase
MARIALLAILWILPASLFVRMPTAAQGTVGVLLLHGKLGEPMGVGLGRRRAIGLQLVYALKRAGYLVATPEMCWSQTRRFDRPYPDCLSEIDHAIAALKSRGAAGIVVGGLSMGGNAAVAYAATHSDLIGVIGLAPADDPVMKTAQKPQILDDVARARSLVEEGQGDKQTSFFDYNTGPQGFYDIALHTTPRIYLSFFETASLANIRANTAKLHVPLLWVAGSSDPTQAAGRSGFDHAAPNALSRYAVVNAGHLDVPDAAATVVVEWIRDVLARARAH